MVKIRRSIEAVTAFALACLTATEAAVVSINFIMAPPKDVPRQVHILWPHYSSSNTILSLTVLPCINSLLSV